MNQRQGLIIGAIAMLLLTLWIGHCHPEIEPTYRPDVPDTVRFDRVYTPPPVRGRPTVPDRVEIYQPDTLARQRAETQPIVRRVERRRKFVETDVLDPRGVTTVQRVELPADVPFTVDSLGQVHVRPQDVRAAKRRRTVRRVGTAVAVGGALVAGFLLGSR